MTGERELHTAAPRPEEPGDLFDVWLQCRLHRLFGSVVEEPIPPELLRILEEAPGSGEGQEEERDRSGSP